MDWYWWVAVAVATYALGAAWATWEMNQVIRDEQKRARARHPASRPRCPRCQAGYTGPLAEHVCAPGLRT